MDQRAKEDLARMRDEARRLGAPVVAVEEIITQGDEHGGEDTLITMVVGERGNLTRNALRQATKHWRQMTDKFPNATIYPAIMGYDADPREIWEIPEARDYFCRWAQRAGLDTLEAVEQSQLHEGAVGFLAKCGALVDVDPDSVGGPARN